MRTDGLPSSDKALWQRVATGEVAREPISDLDFAAWLDGRLSPADAARVEAAVAADPEMRRAALDLADLLGRELPVAPARLTVRAKALVGFEVERPSGRSGLFGWLLAPDRRFAFQRAMALGAAVVVASAGFMMGGGLGASMAQERQAVVSQARGTTDGGTTTSWNAAFELTDLPTAELSLIHI